MGLDLQDGIIQNLMLSVAMSLGSLIIPAVSDTYCRHHRLLAVLVCSVMGGLSIIGFMVSETVTGLSIFLCIGGFFLYAINGLVWPFAMDCGGRELSGTAGAIFGFDAYADPEVQDAIKHALDNNGYEEKYLWQSFGTSELGGKLVAEGKNIEADVVTMSMYYIDSAQQKITCLQI